MADYIAEFCYRCCTTEMHPVLTHHARTLKWVCAKWLPEDESVTVRTLKVIRLYHHTYKRCPPGVGALLAWVQNNPEGHAEFAKSEDYAAEIERLKEYRELGEDELPCPEAALDDDALLSALVTQTRERWLTEVCRLAVRVGIGGAKVNLSGDRFAKATETGVTAAIQYLRGELSHDLSRETPAEAGLLHENAASVLRGLEERLQADNNDGRFPLGLPHIDKLVTVGKQALRFIGVLGMSGDGKTTLTNYITYQWLRQGANVLYCSTEHTPREIWEFMAFLHGSHPDYDFTLPSLREWDKGEVTVEDQANMGVVLHNIQTRKNLPGLLDVQQFSTWDEIKDHLTANHAKNRYDCLVVDYIGRLQVPGDQKWRDKAVGAIVHDAQLLTRSFDNHKGLIVLSPIQVNREGNKAAKAKDDGEQRYDLNGISTVSEWQHDLDLCLSVYSDDDMRMGSQIEVGCPKARKGERGREKMYLDRASWAFVYEPEYGAPRATKAMWERSVEDMVSTTTVVNADDWGL